MVKVYIASPYTKGDAAINVRTQIDAANRLMDFGLNPFVPLMSHFHHMIHPRSYEDWMKVDLDWVSVCDCVLRLPGESVGAGMEVDHAEKLGIPVFYSIEAVLDHYLENKK